MAGAGIAPAWCATSIPPLNIAIVGMAVTRNFRPRLGNSSVFTFATTKRPAVSFAILTTSGATILHGPHQGAQKSTSTGNTEWLVSASKARALLMLIGSRGDRNSLLHWPQWKVCPSPSYFSRLRFPHLGQTTSNPRSSGSTLLMWNPGFSRVQIVHDHFGGAKHFVTPAITRLQNLDHRVVWLGRVVAHGDRLVAMRIERPADRCLRFN